MNKANRYSLKPLLNSFIRDFGNEFDLQITNKSLVINIGSSLLKFGIEKYSALGSHYYNGEISFNGVDISFEESLKKLTSLFSECDETFIPNIINSRDNIALILAQHNEQTLKIDDYLSSEQLLLLGHPFHPYPKCKLGMTVEDMRSYAPEFQNSFKLVWLSTNLKMLFSECDKSELQEKLLSVAEYDLAEINANMTYIPMHPWQWNNLREREDIKLLLSRETILEIGEGRNDWYALSSLRSIYSKGAPFQLKFSMDVKLTNSIRHLTPMEAIRGKQMETVFTNEGVASFNDKFKILNEAYYAALLDSEGNEIIESTFQLRESFDNKDCLLLASLAEINPYTGSTHLRESIENSVEINKHLARKNWFDAFLKNVIGPFLDLADEYGVLLGAHMQNIILKMEDGLPIGVIYRDTQGTGFTLKGLEQYGDKYDFIKDSKGNILDQNDVNKVYTYYLIINSVFNTICALADGNSKDEIYHLSQFRNYIYSRRDHSSFIHYLLESETYFQKGNFRCCVTNINENTVANPWNIYNKIDNPIVKYLRRPRQYDGILYETRTASGHDLRLRALNLESDMEVFHKWHNKPFVYEFWEMNKPLNELRGYVEGLKKSPYQLPIIVDIDGEQAGYFEVYWAYDDRIAPYCNASLYDRGIHILIGEEKYLRTKAVLESIYHLTKFLFEDESRTQKVWGEPREDNKKVLKIAEYLPGWSHVGVFDFPHKRSNLLEAERTRFYAEVGDNEY